MAIDIPPALTKKIGPLPVYAYLLVGGAGLAYVSWRSKRDGGPAPTPLDVSHTEGLEIGSGGPVGLAQGYSPASNPVTPLVIPTNDVWVKKGTKVLVNQGIAGTTGRELLFAYVDPDPDGYTQEKFQQIMGAADRVIAAIGPPPNQNTLPRLQETDPTPHTPTAPTSPEPAAWAHTTTNYDTLTSLAQFYYGHADDWGGIYVANKSAIDAIPGNGPGWNDTHSLREGISLTIPGRGNTSGAPIILRAY